MRWGLFVVLGLLAPPVIAVRFCTRQTLRTLMTGLESALQYLGGVPTELLFDQLKAVVVEDRRLHDAPSRRGVA